MIYLSLSILASIGIFVVFRLLSTYGLHTRQAIMVNYIVAALTGLIAFWPKSTWWHEPWFLPSLCLGVMFYVIFRVMARVTQENGLSVSSIATKMSVVIPVSIGLVFLGESINPLKLLGIILGLVSIVLSAGGSVKKADFLWPLILFAGSGIIDSSLKLFQHFLVDEASFPVFIVNVFLGAFTTSVIHHIFTRERRVSVGTVYGGIVLGLVNFAALYFILKSLALPNWESSVVFPVNNFGIIAGSTLLAMALFRERLNWRGWSGFVLASISILVLYLSK